MTALRPFAATLVLCLVLAALTALATRHNLLLFSTAIAGETADGDRTIGTRDAPAQLDLWSDFQCPSCRLFEARIEPNIIQTFVDTGRARLTFHDMAFLGPESVDAAIAARCAGQQGKFRSYKHLLFANQGSRNSGAFNWTRLTEFAARLHLDTAVFTTCVEDSAVRDAVSAETGQAFKKRVQETPTLLVNGVRVTPVTDWQTVSAAIERASKTP